MKLSHNWKTKLLYLIFSLWMLYAVIQGGNKILKNYNKYRKFQPIGSSITDVRLRQYPVAYSLVLFCNKHLPEGAGILFIGNGADFVRFSYYLYPRWSNVVFGQKGALYDKRHFERNDIRFVIVDNREDPIVKDTQFFANTNGFSILRTHLDT